MTAGIARRSRADHCHHGNTGGTRRGSTSGGRDLSHAALEALTVEAYRARRLSDRQFRRLLGLSRWEADGVRKAYGVWLDYTVDDFNREGEAIRNIRERPQE
jgi:hypothetical protein